jgi:glutamine amidotransferase
MIAIIDYGMGNVRSVEKAFAKLGYSAVITAEAQEIRRASHVVLPGVGAFGDAMRELEQRRLVGLIREIVDSKRPFLGICLGLQVLFERSEEAPGIPGLGIIAGDVVRFRTRLKVPHMGWNQIALGRQNRVLEGIPSGSYFYFVHSYYVVPRDESVIATTTDYDGDFVSMIARGNLYATQFHPEKSQSVGLQLLRNFAAL